MAGGGVGGDGGDGGDGVSGVVGFGGSNVQRGRRDDIRREDAREIEETGKRQEARGKGGGTAKQGCRDMTREM